MLEIMLPAVRISGGVALGGGHPHSSSMPDSTLQGVRLRRTNAPRAARTALAHTERRCGADAVRVTDPSERRGERCSHAHRTRAPAPIAPRPPAGDRARVLIRRLRRRRRRCSGESRRTTWLRSIPRLPSVRLPPVPAPARKWAECRDSFPARRRPTAAGRVRRSDGVGRACGHITPGSPPPARAPRPHPRPDAGVRAPNTDSAVLVRGGGGAGQRWAQGGGVGGGRRRPTPAFHL